MMQKLEPILLILEKERLSGGGRCFLLAALALFLFAVISVRYVMKRGNKTTKIVTVINCNTEQPACS